MKIGFWNINKNNKIESLLLNLVVQQSLDVLIFAEYASNIEKFCNLLNAICYDNYEPLNSLGCDKICGIINSKYKQEIITSSSRYEIINIRSSFFSILLGLIHAPSKLHSSDNDRLLCFNTFYHDIEKAEGKTKINNTIIIGDFNANPFENYVIGACSLHGIPYKEEVAKESRIVQGKEYKMFYNPMWRFFGSQSPPYGTYYYNSSSTDNYFWNTFDQIIFRPALIPAFAEDSLKIITSINNKSLLVNNYKPNKKISDHLPIIFNIQEEKIR